MEPPLFKQGQILDKPTGSIKKEEEVFEGRRYKFDPSGRLLKTEKK